MVLKRSLFVVLVVSLFFSVSLGFSQIFPETLDDPVLEKIIDMGKNENKTMVWLDFLTNRFGGRYIGSDAFNNAAEWAAYQFRSWGMQVELQEAGEMAVGFNRGPWFGKIVKPEEKALYFGTPSFTAGTKGVQRGGVAIAPDDSLKILEMLDQFKNKWVLISDAGKFNQRLGRRGDKPFLEKVLEKAGALGSIQRSRVPLNITNSSVKSWEHLPTLPDIRLQDTQYDDIKEMVSNGEPVKLEFEIRNWFKMGPVKYHNVIAWIPGTEFPDEYLIMSGHLDAFDGGTGAVDCGSGVTPAMEAGRLISLAGAKPKRTIMVHLFAGEEAGILGASAWVRQNPSKIPNIAILMNRDYTPGAIIGVTVPTSWADDFERITKPVLGLNSRFPFEGVTVNSYPGVQSTRLGGTDASAFSMVGVPTIRFREETQYVYRRAWHTLFDTYNEVVPYSEHQEHTALCLAIMAYGISNLDHQLSREGVYLPDGLYVDLNTEKGRIIAELDFEKTPATVASFVQLFEDPNAQRGRRRGGRGRRGPAIGVVNNIDSKVATQASITAENYKKRAVSKLKKEKNPDLKHNQAGVLGMMNPTKFYVTSGKKSDYDKKYTAIGKVIAGLNIVGKIAEGDSLQSVRITRVGQKATDFNRK